MFDNGWQKLIFIVAVLGVIAVFITGVFSMSDENLADLGHWINDNWAGISKTAAGAASAIATYFLGRRAGRKVAKTEAYASAIDTAEGVDTGSEVAQLLRRQAANHNLRLRT